MVGGQVLDLAGEKIRLEADAIHTIHALKTGALISAACRMGAAAAGAGEKEIRAADAYAKALGLAFQLRDDMLDVLGDAEKMGKATGMDGSKNTFVSLYGVGECSKMIERYTDEAIDALADFTDTEFLAELAQRLATHTRHVVFQIGILEPADDLVDILEMRVAVETELFDQRLSALLHRLLDDGEDRGIGNTRPR